MERRAQRNARWGLAAFLGGMTVAHLVRPRAFVSMVPRWVPGDRAGWNRAAAAAEGASALLLASRRTARLGGRLAFVTMLAVYPANLEAVRQGGYHGAPGWLGTRAAAIARLPLQVPLLWWAHRVAAAARARSCGSATAPAKLPPPPAGAPATRTGPAATRTGPAATRR